MSSSSDPGGFGPRTIFLRPRARVPWVRAVALALCVLALAWCTGTHAFVDTSQTQVLQVLGNGYKFGYSSNGVPIAGAARTYTAGAAAGETLVKDLFNVAGPRGSTVAVTATRSLAASALGSAAALAGAAAGGYAIGTALNTLWTKAAVRGVAGAYFAVSGGETLQNPGTGANQWYRGVNATCNGTGTTNGPLFYGLAAAQAQVISICTSAAGGSHSLYQVLPYPDGRVKFDGDFFTMTPTGPVPDALPWCVNAAGAVTVRPTAGVCPAETLTATTLTDVQTKLTDQLRGNPALAPQAAAQLVAQPYAIPGEGAIALTGPATGTASTITQTGAAGNVTTTINNTFNYAGDTLTWNETTTQTTGAGTTTTTATQPQADSRTDCEKNPAAIGCAKMGDLPTDAPAWQTKTVTFTADALGLPAACPAPRSLAIRGWNMQLNYQAACDVAGTIRAAMLAITAVSCALFVIGAIRT